MYTNSFDRQNSRVRIEYSLNNYGQVEFPKNVFYCDSCVINSRLCIILLMPS